jgi:hypothetical protein
MDVHRAEVTSPAARYRLPTVYPWRFYTKLGGLLSYEIDLPDNYGRAAIYADRILKGVKPSELPVQAPVKLLLVINLTFAISGKGLASSCPPPLDHTPRRDWNETSPPKFSPSGRRRWRGWCERSVPLRLSRHLPKPLQNC